MWTSTRYCSREFWVNIGVPNLPLASRGCVVVPTAGQVDLKATHQPATCPVSEAVVVLGGVCLSFQAPLMSLI